MEITTYMKGFDKCSTFLKLPHYLKAVKDNLLFLTFLFSYLLKHIGYSLKFSQLMQFSVYTSVLITLCYNLQTNAFSHNFMDGKWFGHRHNNI